MASQLTLDSNENPDLAEASADCKEGRECQILVTCTLTSNENGIAVLDVKSAEYEGEDEGDSGDAEEAAPAATRPANKKMAPAISKVSDEMA